MNKQTDIIRAEAKRLLESGEAVCVIGYEAGSTPARSTPCFVRSADDVNRLIWSPACTANLALYLRDAAKAGRVAVIAKGCDARSIATLIQENQIKREDVYVIGVPCLGVLDIDSLSPAEIAEAEVMDVQWTNGGLTVSTEAGPHALDRVQGLKESCLFCQSPTPALHDMLAGDPVEPQTAGEPAVDGELDARRQYWAEQFDRCVRCYACRQVCPSCYCTECFSGRMSLRWVSKRILPEENWMYHTTRAMHLAGRCVGCGECERVCPMGIPIQQMMRELGREVEDLFQYKAGMDAAEAPALGSYRDNDEGPKE